MKGQTPETEPMTLGSKLKDQPIKLIKLQPYVLIPSQASRWSAATIGIVRVSEAGLRL